MNIEEVRKRVALGPLTVDGEGKLFSDEHGTFAFLELIGPKNHAVAYVRDDGLFEDKGDLIAALLTHEHNTHQALVEALDFVTRCATMNGPAGTTPVFVSMKKMTEFRQLVARCREVPV